MAYLGILLLAIFVSFIVVRIGGFALQLTGMEPDVARFQALSAFTGTGFTTTEAERVVRHRTRRRIVSILIILGSAGLVTIIATMVATFTQVTGYGWFFIRLGIIVLAIFVLYRVILGSKLGNRAVYWFRRPLMNRILVDAPAIEEVFHEGREWGIYLVKIREKSPSAGSSAGSLTDAGDLEILAIERAEDLINRPDAHETILEGDRLLVYATGKSLKRLSA
jgi:MFS family permease